MAPCHSSIFKLIKQRMETKKIFIKRRIPNNNIPKESFVGTKASIGATLTKSGNINTGLTSEEEIKILPKVLGVPYESNDFFKKMNEYYSALVIRVPYGEEVELDITLTDTGIPVKPTDYIKYRFALVNPEVATSEAEATNIKKFYVYNPALRLQEDYAKLSDKKDAYKEFLKIAGDEKKITMLMTVLGLDTKGLSAQQKELKLEEIAVENSSKFYEVVKDKDLEMKAFIEECVSAQVLQKVGNSYIDGDEKIGSTLQEAILYLNDKSNSSTLVKLKARIEAFKPK